MPLEVAAIVGLRSLMDALVSLRHQRALAHAEVTRCVDLLVDDLEVLDPKGIVEATDLLSRGLQAFAAVHSQWLWGKPFYEALTELSRQIRLEYGTAGLVDQAVDSTAMTGGIVPGELLGEWFAAAMENRNALHQVLDAHIGLTKKPTKDR